MPDPPRSILRSVNDIARLGLATPQIGAQLLR